MYNLTKQNPIVAALAATVSTVLFGAMMYLLFEPATMAAATAPGDGEFIVTQEIGAEISFATTANDVTMNTTIGGETGGTSLGSTTVAITTNDSAGYTLGISFANDTGMQHATLAEFINMYGTTTASTPDYDMNLGATSHGFAYSVSSTNAVAAFLNNGATCGAGSNNSYNNCWVMNQTPTSAFTIVDSSSSATAEQTVIGFQVQVAGSSGLSNGFYYATSTLTATTKS